jgi:hypothetical protein
MSVTRVLRVGGAAVVAMLWTTPAGALPSPPAAPAVPLPSPPVVGVAPVDDVVATVPAVPPAPPALPGPTAVRVPSAGDPPPNVVPTPTTASPAASLPTDPRRINPSAKPTAHAAASHAGVDGAATGTRPAGIEHQAATVVPGENDAVVDARPVGVSGALDRRSNTQPWSSVGTAATSLAWWGALCALALVARRIVISAWRDARRRRRAFSLR